MLGPLLFLIYVNDMPMRVVNSECRLYADDTLLCCDLENSSEIGLQEDVNVLLEWSTVWHMPFNVNKCSHMQVECLVPEFTVALSGQQIPSAHEIKYLGVILTYDLKWHSQINNISKKQTYHLE